MVTGVPRPEAGDPLDTSNGTQIVGTIPNGVATGDASGVVAAGTTTDRGVLVAVGTTVGSAMVGCGTGVAGEAMATGEATGNAVAGWGVAGASVGFAVGMMVGTTTGTAGDAFAVIMGDAPTTGVATPTGDALAATGVASTGSTGMGVASSPATTGDALTGDAPTGDATGEACVEAERVLVAADDCVVAVVGATAVPAGSSSRPQAATAVPSTRTRATCRPSCQDRRFITSPIFERRAGAELNAVTVGRVVCIRIVPPALGRPSARS